MIFSEIIVLEKRYFWSLGEINIIIETIWKKRIVHNEGNMVKMENINIVTMQKLNSLR